MKDTTETFFADTYALIELIGGNTNYKPYLNQLIITSQYNLIELYYHLLHDYGRETADRYLIIYADLIVPISSTSIQLGMQFKLKYKKETVSYVDCIGYAIALELGMKFLTGDQKFSDKENVEFVK